MSDVPVIPFGGAAGPVLRSFAVVLFLASIVIPLSSPRSLYPTISFGDDQCEYCFQDASTKISYRLTRGSFSPVSVPVCGVHARTVPDEVTSTTGWNKIFAVSWMVVASLLWVVVTGVLSWVALRDSTTPALAFALVGAVSGAVVLGEVLFLVGFETTGRVVAWGMLSLLTPFYVGIVIAYFAIGRGDGETSQRV